MTKDQEKYPMHDIAHAKETLAKVGMQGTPAEKRIVREAVYAKYPALRPYEGGI